MPTATALRCFIAVLEEQSGGGKPVGGADTGQRIMARPNRVLFVSLPHLLTRPCSPLLLCLNSRMIGSVHIHGDGQVAEMFFYERLHVLPVEPAHASGQPWKRDTLELLSFDHLAQRFETMIHILDRGPARVAGPVTCSSFLSKQIHNSNSSDARPRP